MNFIAKRIIPKVWQVQVYRKIDKTFRIGIEMREALSIRDTATNREKTAEERGNSGTGPRLGVESQVILSLGLSA